MRDFSTPRTYILSAFIAGASTETNERRHDDLVADLALAGVPFRECEGAYKGVWERSVAVIGASAGNTVAELARRYGQESYLVIAEHDRTAYLVFSDDPIHFHAGRFVAHGPTKPDTEGWTLCDGTYYVIQPTKGPDLPEGL
jgi:hypothetical protein